ncbi:hypothetical protein C9E85_15365 [Plesiomonas shigelloides]|uniref:hypothetical protein n=1 Tax=Plesiomonas shigelloides TaxID=703 RepID=UPI000D582E7A|nr:hypothetical protein [Plesiomonas shigelloides]PVU64994.1 hypothetical protein C9E85_15365 [Plesiomonas shigelloides]
MEQVILRYDGEALVEHSMNLKLVADSLQGIEALVREVHEQMGGKDEELDLQLKGGFQEGSFEFLITLGQHLNDIELLRIIGFGTPIAAGSLMAYLDWLKGKKIQKITMTEEGDCKIVTEDREERIAPSYMRNLLASTSVRNAFSKIISKPLREGGIEVFEALSTEGNKADRTQFVAVTRDDEKSYRAKNTTVIDVVDSKPMEEMVVAFLTVHKDKDVNWRIEDVHGHQYTVKMEDEEFLTRFRRGNEPDIFVNGYTVEMVERENTINLDKSYSIVKVYRPE